MSETTSFGDRLRQYRKARDLTQEELAERVGCSSETIRKIEAGVRKPSKQIASLLAESLGIAPEERPLFVHFARANSSTEAALPITPGEERSSGSRLPVTRLPTPLTSFVGREQEVRALYTLLSEGDRRLITLTGVGGSGKTRLAIRVAGDLRDYFEDGVFFISLASISDPELVVSAIAQALLVREIPGRPLAQSLKDYLRDMQTLLVLDNFEQVMAARLLVVELLNVAPGLRLLLTSREPLHISGEQVYPVSPLRTPDPDRPPEPDVLSGYDAVKLFIQRAASVQPDFRLTSENAHLVGTICGALDGLPLAIELAAARVRVLSLRAILARLGNRLKLLTGGGRDLPPRQQTLRAAIGWSFDLLDEAEKLLFRRLAVFVGGCTLEAAEAVCNPDAAIETDILDELSSLVDKSIVGTREAQGEVRFEMLETIREYALEGLEATGEGERSRHSHAAYFLSLAEAAGAHAREPQEVEWLDSLEGEHDNLRSVLTWSLEAREAEIALRMAGALARLWFLRGYLSEGRQWIISALQLGERDAALRNTSARAKALYGAALLAQPQGDFAAGRPYLEESVRISRELGERRALADSLNMLAVFTWSQGDYAEADLLLHESVDLFRELGDPLGVARSLNNLGEVARCRGDYETAGSSYAESLALARQRGNRLETSAQLHNLGYVALHDGDFRYAMALFEESLSNFGELGLKSGVAASLTGLAAAYAIGGQPERAARLFGAAEHLREEIGAFVDYTDSIEYVQAVAVGRAHLDEASWVQAWQEGRAMKTGQAISWALRDVRDS